MSDGSTLRNIIDRKPVVTNLPMGYFQTRLQLPENPHRNSEGGLRTKGHFKEHTPEHPLISIITVVFNGEAHLEDTLLSVMAQTWTNIEYIVIDG